MLAVPRVERAYPARLELPYAWQSEHVRYAFREDTIFSPVTGARLYRAATGRVENPKGVPLPIV